MSRFCALALSLSLVAACGSKDRAGDSADDLGQYMPDELPVNCMETSAGGGTGPEDCQTGGIGEDACGRSGDCNDSQICAAPFDGDLGFFECQVACVQTLDDFRWCSDDASCCDAGAFCSPRGYCILE